jgi:hypothetical protein
MVDGRVVSLKLTTFSVVKQQFPSGSRTKCKNSLKGRFEIFGSGSSFVSLSSPFFVFVRLFLNVCCSWYEIFRGGKTKTARGTESENRGKDSAVEAKRIRGKNIRLRALQRGNSGKRDWSLSFFWLCFTLDFVSSIPFPYLLILCLYVVPSWPPAQLELRGKSVRLSKTSQKSVP